MLAVQVQYLNYLEEQRHNKAIEGETARHNVVTEGQGERSLNIQQFSADTARMAHNEQARHNQATESLGVQTLEETKRHNLAYESETYRHNVATESTARLQAQAAQTSASAALQNAAANATRAALEQTKWEKEGKYQTTANIAKSIAEAKIAVENVEKARYEKEIANIKSGFAIPREFISAISPFTN